MIIDELAFESLKASIIPAGSFLKGNMEMVSAADIKGTIEGDISSQGTLRISGFVKGNVQCLNLIISEKGRIEGDVNVYNSLLVAEKGIIDGDVECEDGRIEGKINGKIKCEEELQTASTSTIKGNVICGSLKADPASTFLGRVNTIYQIKVH